jgi:signal transduction histidine kinase/CheY-like chemotaxis protein/hypoxanthine-guanine phosphoribosyltransferase
MLDVQSSISNLQMIPENFKTILTGKQIEDRLREIAVEIIVNKLPPTERELLLIPIMAGAERACGRIRQFMEEEIQRRASGKEACRISEKPLYVKRSMGTRLIKPSLVNFHYTKEDFFGKIAVIVDDMVDEGLTLQLVHETISRFGPSKLLTVVVVKKSNVNTDGWLDYAAFQLDYPLEEAGKRWLFGYGMDIHGEGRELYFIGATGIGLSVNSASKLIENYQKRYNRQVYFVGRDGIVILSGAKSLAPGMNIMDQPFLLGIARDILNSDSGSFEYVNNGKTVFLNTRFIRQLGWYVFVEQIENAAAQLPKTLLLNLTICFVIMAVILFAVTYNIRAYQNRIEKNSLELYKANENLQKANNEAEAASRIKGEFLATMSHEIRTPINGVLGMAELLLETHLSHEQQQKVKTISRSAESLLFLVNDILDFSKVEAGKLEMEEADFHLHQLLEELGAPFKEICLKKGISFNSQILPGVPERVRSDPHRLRQILANLLSNAVKFTEKGEVALTVEPDPSSPLRIKFHVKDTGIGLPPGKIEKLFEPFTQADSSTSRKFGGTGLGLSIARKLAELMGGELQARALLEPGSVFTLSLPFKEAREKLRSDPELSAISEVLPKEAKILIVEDDPTNQQVILAMLRNLGLSADVAENGLKALEKLKEESYELVFMDCNLPEMDGYSACRAFREWEKSGEGGRRTPIVALTANAIKGDREKCLAAGMDDYLPKPVRLSELKGTLLRWLSGTKEDILSESELNLEQKSRSFKDAATALKKDLGKEAIFIIENFRNSLPRRLDSIRKALEEKSVKNLAMASHALRGASLSFGFERMGKLAGELENLGETGQLGGADDLFAAVESEAAWAVEALEREMG